MDLRDPKKYPRVPGAVREQANRLLKHYPSKFDMDLASESAPDVFGDRKPLPKWKCPINDPDCTSNCGNYGCGN